MNTKMLKWVQIACVAVLIAGGVATAQAGASDAWVSTKVKMLLINSPVVGGMPIHVDTDEGRVTLHGKVHTSAERTEAGRIARAGTGVVSVRNLLQVVPDSRRKAVNLTDDRIKADVEDALKAEGSLANSSIGVKSVNKRVVLLSGKASTLSDHLLAMEVASGVPGVRQVATEIESPDEFADREVYYDDTPVEPSRGSAVSDGWITAQAKMRFMTDNEIPASDINVDTRRGVVTLFGTVPTAAVMEKAVRVTSEISGVRSVTRELRVVPASRKKLATINDDAIGAAVRTRLGNANFEGSTVQVEVRAATARLTGTVRHASQRYAVVSIAYATPGVVRVQNDVRIEPLQTSAN